MADSERSIMKEDRGAVTLETFVPVNRRHIKHISLDTCTSQNSFNSHEVFFLLGLEKVFVHKISVDTFLIFSQVTSLINTTDSPGYDVAGQREESMCHMSH